MKRIFILLAALTAFFATDARGAETPQDQKITSYMIGDYYNDGMKEGIVFEVSAGGKKGKIVSLHQAPLMSWSVTKDLRKTLIGATSETDGRRNMEAAKAVSGWEEKLPAFAWCATLGDEWYLPSKQELQAIYKHKDLLDTQLIDKIGYSWSSTEHKTPDANEEYSAWVVNLKTASYPALKFVVQPVRAIAAFDLTRPTPVTGDTYVVGDYYDDGVKQGVVFEVDDLGKRGKIISMLRADKIQWISDKEEETRFIFAISESNGRENAARVKEIPGWKDKYPAYDWCSNLGEGWYVPSLDEVKTILEKRSLLHINLPYKVSEPCWTSTEADYALDKDKHPMRIVFERDNKPVTASESKTNSVALFAVNTFDCTKPATPSGKKYKVGDYYNDGVKVGVVFEVSEDGNHGKIVSLDRSGSLNWGNDPAENTRLVGASDTDDGKKNMDLIKSIPGWETRYPVFKWCADQGEGWYLPSRDELYRIFYNSAFINDKLTTKMDQRDSYWSSTEDAEKDRRGNCCAYKLYLSGAFISGTGKYVHNLGSGYVRAVATF